MAWTDLQRRMLAEMGLPAWLAPAPAVPVPGTGDDAERQAIRSDAESEVEAEATSTGPVGQTVSVATAEHVEVDTVPAHATTAPASFATTGGLDWDGLRSAVARCTACDLCHGRTQTVFGSGGPPARWMVVGDAPRENEDRTGEPFVGRSGALLDNMLAALRLTRGDGSLPQHVFVTNALKCRLPGPRIPSPEELAACEGHLLRQIELLQPSVILVIGRYALQSMLRSSEPIGRLRGRVYRYHNVPLVATYDPAYLLRHPEHKARAWDDLCLAAEAAEAAPQARISAA